MPIMIRGNFETMTIPIPLDPPDQGKLDTLSMGGSHDAEIINLLKPGVSLDTLKGCCWGILAHEHRVSQW